MLGSGIRGMKWAGRCRVELGVFVGTGGTGCGRIGTCWKVGLMGMIGVGLVLRALVFQFCNFDL